MKTRDLFGGLVLCGVLLMASAVQAAAGTADLPYAVVVTPEVRKAFPPGDGIEIRSVTGTAETFQVGGTYRVTGVCRQHSTKNALLYVGNTSSSHDEAIRASEGSELFKPLTEAETEFDVAFTVLQPGQLHVSFYDMDNRDRRDNAVGGIVLGQVASP
jgi:hypothetical protein